MVFGRSAEAVGPLHTAALRCGDALPASSAQAGSTHRVAGHLGAPAADARAASSRSIPLSVSGRPDLSDLTRRDVPERRRSAEAAVDLASSLATSTLPDLSGLGGFGETR